MTSRNKIPCVNYKALRKEERSPLTGSEKSLSLFAVGLFNSRGLCPGARVFPLAAGSIPGAREEPLSVSFTACLVGLILYWHLIHVQNKAQM